MHVLQRLRSLHTIRQRPVAALLIITAYLTAGLAVALFAVSHRRILSERSNLPISDIAAIFQSTIGPAVALGGAIAAVYLAVLGLRIIETQSIREDTKQVVEFASKSLSPFLRLNTILVELLTVIEGYGSWMLAEFDSVVQEELRKAESSKVGLLPAELARQVFASELAFQETARNYVSELCQEMDVALGAISASPEALALWRTCKSRARIEELGARPNRDALDLNSSPSTVRSMLYGLRDLFRIASTDLETQMSLILRLHRYRDMSLVPLEPTGEDDMKLRMFLLSTFIVSRDDGAKWKGRNTTAAAILDCFDATPTAEETVAFLEKQFFSGKSLPKVIRNYVVACSPSDTVPPFYRSLLALKTEELLVFHKEDDA